MRDPSVLVTFTGPGGVDELVELVYPIKWNAERPFYVFQADTFTKTEAEELESRLIFPEAMRAWPSPII